MLLKSWIKVGQSVVLQSAANLKSFLLLLKLFVKVLVALLKLISGKILGFVFKEMVEIFKLSKVVGTVEA